MSVDADAEMREALLAVCIEAREEAHPPEYVARRIVDILHHRGAWLPGDPVTDAMANAACFSLAVNPGYNVSWTNVRSAVAAALESRKPLITPPRPADAEKRGCQHEWQSMVRFPKCMKCGVDEGDWRFNVEIRPLLETFERTDRKS